MKTIDAYFYPESRYGMQKVTIVIENVTRFHPLDEFATYVMSGSDGAPINIPYEDFKRIVNEQSLFQRRLSKKNLLILCDFF